MLGASAVALVALQPNGVSELAGSAVVFTAGVALSPVLAAAVGGAVTAGVAVALSLAGGVGAASVAASALLCAVLGITGSLLRRYRLSQASAELLLAQLEDARDDQARAAAAQERPASPANYTTSWPSRCPDWRSSSRWPARSPARRGHLQN